MKSACFALTVLAVLGSGSAMGATTTVFSPSANEVIIPPNATMVVFHKPAEWVVPHGVKPNEWVVPHAAKPAKVTPKPNEWVVPH